MISLPRFDEIHGAGMMSILKMPNFDIFKLNIQNGRLVKGFGKAYDITVNNDDLIINDVVVTGHKMRI